MIYQVRPSGDSRWPHAAASWSDCWESQAGAGDVLRDTERDGD